MVIFQILACQTFSGTCHGLRAPLLAFVPLAKPVAQTVGRDDVEDFPSDAVSLFSSEVRQRLLEAVGFEFREQRLQAVDMERATVLRRIAAGFRQSDLDLV